MKIKLTGAGKRFNREWIFRKADLLFQTGTSYAITGPNGSGKSTLLQSIGGLLQLSEGTLEYFITENKKAPENLHPYVSLCAPYLEVIEEMTVMEFLQFHFRFKHYLPGMTAAKAVEEVGLKSAAHKQIRFYSSGMKQRVKLAQAIFCTAPVVLLDEPCSNLDAQGIELYHTLIRNYCTDRLVIVSSNDVTEYGFCNVVLEIAQWK